MSRPQTFQVQKAIRPFFWSIICSCTSNDSFRILKKAGGNIFSKWYNFKEIAKKISLRKFLSSFFQYSERTITSTKTNDTSKERSDTLFEAGNPGAVALSGKLHAFLSQRGIEQKVNLTEQRQDAFVFLILPILFICQGKSGIIKFEFKTI